MIKKLLPIACLLTFSCLPEPPPPPLSSEQEQAMLLSDDHRLKYTHYVFDARTQLCFLEFTTAYGYHGYTLVPCSESVLKIAIGAPQ